MIDMKRKTDDIILMGVIVLFCSLPVFSICPFNLPGANIAQYFVMWLKLLAYFAVGGIVGYILRKVADRKLCIGYIAVMVLYIMAIVVMALLPVEISSGSFIDTYYGVELWMIFLLSLLVMLGYACIDKLVKLLSGREWNFNLGRCFLVMAGVPITLWNIDYWVNGIDGIMAYNIVTLHVARKFGIVISGLVAGRMMEGINKLGL
jgi:hypothetical protein